MKWTDSDNLGGRDALVVGGHADGMLVSVRRKRGQYRYPDVVDLSGYIFDPVRWEFREVSLPRRGPGSGEES